ncbi:hypothetical protein MPER_05099, partial [Moniliophthora perniciosa FA553]
EGDVFKGQEAIGSSWGPRYHGDVSGCDEYYAGSSKGVDKHYLERDVCVVGCTRKCYDRYHIKLQVGAVAKDTVIELGPWKYADSLPEIRDYFDDSDWVEANHTQTNIPHRMLYGDGRVLYGCDYGSCENIVLWRGHFIGTGMEKSVNLSVNGGEAFAASVWLNDVFLKTTYGNSTNNNNIIAETDEVFAFPEGIVEEGGLNVITIVQVNILSLAAATSKTNLTRRIIWDSTKQRVAVHVAKKNVR